MFEGGDRFCRTSPGDAGAIIKRRRLLEELIREPDRFREELMSRVLPLLDGLDHSRLQFFFVLKEKSANGDAAVLAETQAHRLLLKNVAKLLPGQFIIIERKSGSVFLELDYKQFAFSDSDVAWQSLYPVVTTKNVDLLTKLGAKLPNRVSTNN